MIDKSGYIVNRKRDDLKRRAAALRAERAKSAYQATSNADEIAGIRAKVEAKKAALLAELAAATTADAMKPIIDKFWKYNGIGSIFGDLERLEARDAAKEYPSVESYRRAADGIAAALENL